MFGYKLVKVDESPRRGNLKRECLYWTGLALLVVLLFLLVSDFVAKYCFDSTKAMANGFVCFSYVHIGVAIAIVATAFAFLAVVVTTKVNETMSLHSFNTRYGDPNMHKDINAIGAVERRWKALRKTDVKPSVNPYDTSPDAVTRSAQKNTKGRIVISNYDRFVDNNDRFLPWTKDEDKSRRVVKNYFSSALELYRCGAISKKTLRVICDTDAITLMFNVVEPMEYLINEEYKFDVFYDLMKVVKDIYTRKVEESMAHRKTKNYKVLNKDDNQKAKGTQA